MKVALISTQQLTSTVYTFTLQPDQAISWQAGQYLRYHLTHSSPDERGENRFFTISSAPYEKFLQITTRINSTSSSFKKKLLMLQKGDTFEAFGPNGTFTLEDPANHYVFIAGGIGITPFRSIIQDLDHRKLPINITLLYANRNEEIVFQKELAEIATRHPEFTIQYFIGENQLDINSLQSLTSIPHPPNFYISGPEQMMKHYIQMLQTLGISEENIKHDYFPGYE